MPELGGPATQPEPMTPDRASVSLQDGSDVQELSPLDHYVLDDTEEFWTTWLSEIRESEIAGSHSDEELDAGNQWDAVCSMTTPPACDYFMHDIPDGLHYAASIADKLPKHRPSDPAESLQSRNLDEQMIRLSDSLADRDFTTMQLLPQDEHFAELEIPVWLAYLSGVEVPGHLLHDENYVVVYQIDKMGIKRTVIENKIASNANVSDDELRRLMAK